MTLGANTLYILIIACEVAFWLALGAGLACRYVWQRQRLGRILLLAVPLIDVALLALTIADLRAGAIVTFAHGLATAYVAFTIAFGANMLRWADAWFAHRFAGGPHPAGPSTRSAAVRAELKLWARCLVAVLLIHILLTVVIALVGNPDRTQALLAWYRIPLGTALFWFVFGPVWSLLFFRATLASAET